MEVKKLEDKKGKAKFEIKGADHLLVNLLVQKLLESRNVEFATYSRPHPLLEGFVLTVRGKKPEDEVKKAVKEVKKDAASMKKALTSAK